MQSVGRSLSKRFSSSLGFDAMNHAIVKGRQGFWRMERIKKEATVIEKHASVGFIHVAVKSRH